MIEDDYEETGDDSSDEDESDYGDDNVWNYSFDRVLD